MMVSTFELLGCLDELLCNKTSDKEKTRERLKKLKDGIEESGRYFFAELSKQLKEQVPRIRVSYNGFDHVLYTDLDMRSLNQIRVDNRILR